MYTAIGRTRGPLHDGTQSGYLLVLGQQLVVVQLEDHCAQQRQGRQSANPHLQRRATGCIWESSRPCRLASSQAMRLLNHPLLHPVAQAEQQQAACSRHARSGASRCT